MYQFPEIRKGAFTLPRVRPTYADVLSGLMGDPEIEDLLIGSGLPEPIFHVSARYAHLPSTFGHPHVAAHPSQAHAITKRRQASLHMVSWLEAHDPLFAATSNMLFDLTDSWPPKTEIAFWKTIEGQPLRFLELYSEVRDIADALFEEPRV